MRHDEILMREEFALSDTGQMRLTAFPDTALLRFSERNGQHEMTIFLSRPELLDLGGACQRAAVAIAAVDPGEETAP